MGPHLFISLSFVSKFELYAKNKNCKCLKFNHLQFNFVPRAGMPDVLIIKWLTIRVYSYVHSFEAY